MKEKTIIFNSPGGWISFIIIAAFMMIWILWFYRRLPRPVSSRLRLFLGTLRILVVLVALFLWLRPAMKTTVYEVKKPLLVFLTDQSRSMSELRDGPDGRSRSETVQLIFSENAKLVERLNERYEVVRMQFAKSILPGSQPAGSKPDPSLLEASNYGDSLEAARQRAALSGCAGIAVIGDGASNYGKSDPVDAALSIGNQEVPVYTVGIGNESPTGKVRDINVVDLRCPQTAYLYSRIPVEGKILMRGYRGESVDVRLNFPGMETQKRRITAVSDNEIIYVEFNVVPEKEGEFKLSLRAQWLRGEIIEHNNVSSTYVKVVKGGLKIGYFDRLRPEGKFINYALSRAQQASLHRITWPEPNAERRKKALNWKRYDVVVIGDVTAVSFGREVLESLLAKVQQGGAGLLLLLGEQSGGRAGFAGSVIEKALPVTLPAAGAKWQPGPVKLVPEKIAVGHSVLQISETDPPPQAWEKLEPLDGVFSGLKAKRSANVLLKSKDMPVLLVQQYGRGRSACLAANTTFRWFFTRKDTQELYLRFWRQLVMWLAGQDEKPSSKVWISIPRRRWKTGEKMPVKVLVTSDQGTPAPDAEVELKLSPVGADTSRDIKLAYSTKEGAFTGAIEVREAGDFQLSARAAQASKELGTDSLRFVVEKFDRELDQPVADHRMLRRLAAATEQVGGKFVQWQRFNWLLSELYHKGKRVVVPRTDVRDIWDRTWVFALFFLLIVTDWIVRKLKGLV